MPVLENASLYVELGAKCNADMQSKMLEMMRSLKEDFESLKACNLKLMDTKSDQEEINELILKCLAYPLSPFVVSALYCLLTSWAIG